MSHKGRMRKGESSGDALILHSPPRGGGGLTGGFIPNPRGWLDWHVSG